MFTTADLPAYVRLDPTAPLHNAATCPNCIARLRPRPVASKG